MEDKLIRVENLKNSEIAHLEKENSKLEREIQKLNSKIDKMERQSSLDADKQQSRI
jgi:predicted  nucleic acid-binding Zn-ribbon protein